MGTKFLLAKKMITVKIFIDLQTGPTRIAAFLNAQNITLIPEIIIFCEKVRKNGEMQKVCFVHTVP